MTIHRYPLAITDHQVLDIPGGYESLHVGLGVDGKPSLWSKVDPERPQRACHVYIVGTGETIPQNANLYLGTFVLGLGVWHVFTR